MTNVTPQKEMTVSRGSAGLGRRTQIDYSNKERTTERVR